MRSIAETIAKHLPTQGEANNILPYTSFYRVDQVQPVTPLVYQPSLFFVAQGEKEAWLENERFVYNPDQYLLLTVPLPLRCRVFNAEPDKPFLALKLDIDLPVLTELLAQMPPQTLTFDQSETGILVSENTPALRHSVERLVGTLEDPDQKSVLAPMIYREILFHVMQGPHAARLRNFAMTDRQNNRIATAINFIHRNYNQALRVDKLAEIAAMSPSTFYEHFRNVTRLSPVQYLKNIRLHHAKHQIFVEQKPVNEAAYSVGYESPSQFSREYKRLFGHSPRQHLQLTG
jgi:AraC-like DNA-binding protein